MNCISCHTMSDELYLMSQDDTSHELYLVPYDDISDGQTTSKTLPYGKP